MMKSAPLGRLNRYFSSYASYHQTKGNELCHALGIPLIVISLLGMLGHLPVTAFGLSRSDYIRVDGGSLLWLISALWYTRLDWKLTLPFNLVLLGFYFVGRAIPVPALVAAFFGGWIFQALGHAKFEKKKPAFMENASHLLIGPLWIFARAVGFEEER